MNDTTVSDPNRDDDERDEARALPAERHHAVDAAGAEAELATDGGPRAGHSTSEQSEVGDGDRASFEFGIGKVDGPVNFHDIYLRIRGQSLLQVLLALLLAMGLVVAGYYLLTVGL